MRRRRVVAAEATVPHATLPKHGTFAYHKPTRKLFKMLKFDEEAKLVMAHDGSIYPQADIGTLTIGGKTTTKLKFRTKADQAYSIIAQRQTQHGYFVPGKLKPGMLVQWKGKHRGIFLRGIAKCTTHV